MQRKPGTGLLLVGHGSTQNPDSSPPTHVHADEIRRRGLFDEVACCFWKEEPSMREARHVFEAREVYVVPNFISEGYFTQTVIPRELELSGPRSTRADGTIWKYCEPAGNHSSMTDLLLRRAREIAPELPEEEISLLIVGHGTGLNDNSAVAAKAQAARIAERSRYAEVISCYMEEPPLVANWDELTTAPNVVVVPFFIADGLHSYQDIPVLLGMESEPTAAASQRAVFRHEPRRLRGRNLYYASAIGTEPGFADVILDLVAAFDDKHGTH
ncbi:MAG: cobalamin biosynthesis protein CbiX [Verrucomicrobia bacterium]|nr:cobalamin biosynthesis protein CbiX [Verrucomicrobiota bacterium]